jgi:xanthine phosphoribosyltransferase
MKALEEKILAEGKVYPGNILKVGSFLNHRLDVEFLLQMGEEIARLFEKENITKIITIEASGIAIAMAAAVYMKVPVVFAKKNQSANLSPDNFTSKVHSYTHNRDYDIILSKEFLNSRDRVLIVDDFLAKGKALNGLMDIVAQAGAETAGIAIAIEKGFQGGGDALRKSGMRVESLAIVESMDDCKIVFRQQH